MQKLQFSGHESFHCRQFWLKKGIDFINSGGKFSDESSVVDLGVGKNMVPSIRFWLRAFDLLDDKDKPTKLANRIFDDAGWDPYLEDEGTLWLLHYHLSRKGFASAFQLVFSNLRRTKPEFSKKEFLSLANSLAKVSESTLATDYKVFQNTYITTTGNKGEVEDTYAGILTELALVSKRKGLNEELLVIEGKKREVPYHILLYAILENKDYGSSISFDNLFDDKNGVASIFALSRDGLMEKLEEIAQLEGVTFKSDAGIRELQFKEKFNPISILTKYYGRKV